MIMARERDPKTGSITAGLGAFALPLMLGNGIGLALCRISLWVGFMQ